MGKIRFDFAMFEQPSLDELAQWTAEQIVRERRDALNEEAAQHIRQWVPAGWWHSNRLYVGEVNIEEVWPEGSDEPNLHEISFECLGCRSEATPFPSRSVVACNSGWRWVGISHQEPFTDYFFACEDCGQPMLFTIYTPQ